MERALRRVAGYEVGREVGHGGMGIVYLAKHVHLDRDVALKVLTAELAGDTRFRERFIRESRIAASLTHPNIIPIYDAGEDEGRLYIAMRFIHGRDLREHLKTEGPMKVETALGVIRQVAAALDRAHQASLVHRDVKPANVMLADPESSEHGVCFLTDFGLSRHATSKTLTRSGQVVGTLDYLSPEQIEDRPVDGRADLYSLACVFFELLTGRSPFHADSDAAVLWAHMSKAPPSLADMLPGSPRALDRAMVRALSKKAADRFNTCGEFVEEVERSLDDRSDLLVAPTSKPECMWCPMCGSEYRPGFTRCLDCDVGLVDTEPRTAHTRLRQDEPLATIFVGTEDEAETMGAHLQRRGVPAAVGPAPPDGSIDRPGQRAVVVRADDVPRALEVAEGDDRGTQPRGTRLHEKIPKRRRPRISRRAPPWRTRADLIARLLIGLAIAVLIALASRGSG